jgi:heme o synthase
MAQTPGLTELDISERTLSAAAPAVPGDAAVADWLTLLKPRVVALVAFTGAIGIVVAPGHIHPVLALATVLAIAVAAGGAGAINMWYDRDIDAIMRRTRSRPIPGGRIAPREALGFGVTLVVASVIVLGLATNFVAALVLVLSVAFYVFIYTIWLKRRTPQNIVIGGAAGAFPPVVGWASVTGTIDLMPLVLFAIIFFWTPPHFWSLSLFAHADYERAGVPMLPVVAGARETRRQIVLYTVLLAPLSLSPWAHRRSGSWNGFPLECLARAERPARRERQKPHARRSGKGHFPVLDRLPVPTIRGTRD